jgi:hypothetical protein
VTGRSPRAAHLAVASITKWLPRQVRRLRGTPCAGRRPVVVVTPVTNGSLGGFGRSAGHRTKATACRLGPAHLAVAPVRMDGSAASAVQRNHHARAVDRDLEGPPWTSVSKGFGGADGSAGHRAGTARRGRCGGHEWPPRRLRRFRGPPRRATASRLGRHAVAVAAVTNGSLRGVRRFGGTPCPGGCRGLEGPAMAVAPVSKRAVGMSRSPPGRRDSRSIGGRYGRPLVADRASAGRRANARRRSEGERLRRPRCDARDVFVKGHRVHRRAIGCGARGGSVPTVSLERS